MTESVIGALLAIVLFLAVYLDIQTSRIPNWLTFTAMGNALLIHIWLEGIQGAIFSLSGLATGLILFLTLYFWGPMGAGDVKLMAAVGAMVGPYGAFISGLLAVIVGGIYALAAMFYEWGVPTTTRKLASTAVGTLIIGDPHCGQDLKLPYNLRYGLAIASGTLLFRFGLHPFGG
jgi:prepilin peptidase CpaA